MKKITIVTSVALFALVGMSCEEPAPPSYVEGIIHCNGCSQATYELRGDLQTDGGDYFGSCERDGDNFNFVVGNKAFNNVSGAMDYYLEIKGVDGPPTAGVFQATGEIKTGPRTDFELGTLATGANSWAIDPAAAETDGDGASLCYVTLFAEAGEGELTTTRQTFDFYVNIDCGGLDIDSNGQMLYSFDAEFFFGDC